MTTPSSQLPQRDPTADEPETTRPHHREIPTTAAADTDTYAAAARDYAQAAGHRIEDSALTGRRARRTRRLVGLGIAIGLFGNVAVALTQVLPSSPRAAIVLGILAVVILGAGGLACRGVGELRDSPGWKASGCFLCATAYLGTATVALVNGVPLIFQP